MFDSSCNLTRLLTLDQPVEHAHWTSRRRFVEKRPAEHHDDLHDRRPRERRRWKARGTKS